MMYAHVTDKAVLIGAKKYVNTDDIAYKDIMQDVVFIV